MVNKGIQEIMNATKLDIDWNENGEAAVLSSSTVGISRGKLTGNQSFLTRHISSPNSALRCPHCDSIIYSRRNKLCGVCSQTLPAEYLFTPREARRVEQILRIEQRRHKDWMHRIFKRAVELPSLG